VVSHFETISLLIPLLEVVWEKEFDSIEGPPGATVSNLPLSEQISATPGTQQEVQPKLHTPQEADELARTAGLLIESVRDEENPKFQNSQFMGLMRQLRDGEVVVEGDKMVEKGFGVSGARWANDFQMDVKGKGREVDMPTQDTDTSPSADQLDARRAYRSFIRGFSPTRTEVRSLAANSSIEETAVHREEDPNDVYFQQENAEYIQYWNAHHTEPTERATVAKSQSADWDRMQQQWDQFEASSTGIKPVDAYQFQDNNPYLLGDRSRTRQHMTHLNGPQSFYEVYCLRRLFYVLYYIALICLFQSVLELEAAVQRDPDNASAWYELGVKQQENEREHKAIQALRRSIDLDSSHLPTWVALAVSYANDSDRTETYNAINEWVKRNTLYQDAVQRYRAEFPDDPTAPSKERFSQLIECLIAMARSDMDGAIDPDTQVALAVLLNTNEVCCLRLV
jgi:peroxin-5